MDNNLTTNDLLISILSELREMKKEMKIQTEEIFYLNDIVTEYYTNSKNDSHCDCDLHEDDDEMVYLFPSKENCSDCDNIECIYNPDFENDCDEGCCDGCYKKIVYYDEDEFPDCFNCDDISCEYYSNYKDNKNKKNKKNVKENITKDLYSKEKQSLMNTIAYLLDEYEMKFGDTNDKEEILSN